MPIYSWLLSSLLVSQIGGNPSAPVTGAPPTTNPQGQQFQPQPIREPLPLAGLFTAGAPAVASRPARTVQPQADAHAGDDCATGGRRPHPAARQHDKRPAGFAGVGRRDGAGTSSGKSRPFTPIGGWRRPWANIISLMSASSGSPDCGREMTKRPICEPLGRLPRRKCARPRCRSRPPSTIWRRFCFWFRALPCPCPPTNRWLAPIARCSLNCLPERRPRSGPDARPDAAASQSSGRESCRGLVGGRRRPGRSHRTPGRRPGTFGRRYRRPGCPGPAATGFSGRRLSL